MLPLVNLLSRGPCGLHGYVKQTIEGRVHCLGSGASVDVVGGPYDDLEGSVIVHLPALGDVGGGTGVIDDRHVRAVAGWDGAGWPDECVEVYRSGGCVGVCR